MSVDIIPDFTRSKDKLVLDRSTFRTLKKGRLRSFETVKTIAQAKASDEQSVTLAKQAVCSTTATAARQASGRAGCLLTLKMG